VEKLAKPKQLRPDELMYDLMSARRLTPESMLNAIVENNRSSLDLRDIPSLADAVAWRKNDENAETRERRPGQMEGADPLQGEEAAGAVVGPGVEIAPGGIDAGVSERGLDQVDRGAAVERMRRMGVAEPVG
jgi:hypothetical protein